jgi:hypothetical protein
MVYKLENNLSIFHYDRKGCGSPVLLQLLTTFVEAIKKKSATFFWSCLENFSKFKKYAINSELPLVFSFLIKKGLLTKVNLCLLMFSPLFYS